MRPFVLFACVVTACLVARARADDSQAALSPPVLEQFVPAELASDAPLESGNVGLVLTIDAAGHVSEVVVETSLDPALDSAASAAAKRFVFRPATRAGVPISARVRYLYAFEAPLPSTPSAPPRAESVLLGSVLDRATGAPIVGADLALTSETGSERTLISDENGRFSFQALAAGRYRLRVQALGYAPFEQAEELKTGERVELSYRLSPSADAQRAAFSAKATVDAPPREIVRRHIEHEELLHMAGTRGDPLRTLELLPGVARPPQGAGVLIVRGSAPGDSEVFLDGAPIYNLYHFGGLTSVANGQLLSGIDLYPGNFSARYGRKTGGVVETNFRDPKSDGVHGILDVNMIDASLLVEAPITDTLSIAIAGRRSYLDAWFKHVAQSSDLSVVSAPVYYDYQAILAWKPGKRDRVRLLGYGSYDELTLISAQASEQDPALRGRFGSVTSFHRGQLEWHHDWSTKVDSDVMVGAGPALLQQQMGAALGFKIKGFDIITRAELHARLHERLRLNVGIDAHVLRTELGYRGPRAQQDEGNPANSGPIAGREETTVDTTRSYVRPALYAELVAVASKKLELTAGVRADYFGEIKAYSVDPRFNARLAVTETTTLRAGVGRFSQPPDITETVGGYGNPKLDPIHALHVGLGAEQRIGAHASVSLDGFYKQLSDLIVNGSAPGELENRGVGRIYGLEVMGKLQPSGRFSGYLSYTLSRSERDDRDGTGYRLFDYDQTHILTASGNVKLGKGWLLGTTFRLATGNPYTPIVSSLYNANLDVYEPEYGATNSARSKYFHRLDVRIEKRWAIGEKGAGITAYLDVQNIYNRMNPEGSQYNFDYAHQKAVPGLPIIPSLGLRGEL
jgi:TonB family protein